MSTKQKEESKATSKRIRSLKEEKVMKEFAKATSSIYGKKEGIPKEIAMRQFEEAVSSKNIGKGLDKQLKKGDMSSVKKIADAAADEKQLTRTARKLQRDILNGNGNGNGKKYGETDLL